MKTVSFVHANTAAVADLLVAKIYYYYWSDAAKATVIVSDAGAYFPAREGFDDVKRRISEAHRGPGELSEGAGSPKEQVNGT